MAPTKDHGVRELSRMELKLRDDLVLDFQTTDGQPCYLIEDPANSRFYRIGIPEYTFISLLDGTTPIREAISLTAQALGRDAFTERDAASICRWLIDSQLAFTDEAAQAGRLFAAAGSPVKKQLQQWMNPVFVKLPLVNPDRFLEAVTPWCGWMVSRAAFAVWSVIVLTGLYQLLIHWNRFAAASRGILAPGNWLVLLVVWGLLKVVHEFFHGLACKRLGGNVLEGGVTLILFVPMAYVDVTSAWRMNSKWQRIFISSAGMYVEVFLAALALHVWAATEVGPINHLAYNVVMMAGFTTLLFNGNPLMRFDGYYILSDLLDIPNLYSRGQEFTRYFGRRYLLGMQLAAPQWPREKARIIKPYGMLALVWRLMVSIGLIIAAQTLFKGAGLVLAGLSVVMWWGLPLWRLISYVAVGNTREQPRRLYILAVSSSIAIVVSAVLFGLRWPGVVSAPAVVQYAPLAVVRADSPGFVQQLLVESDQAVESGQLLAVLRNDELAMELVDLKLAIQQGQLRRRRHQGGEETASAQIEERFLEALHEQLREKTRQAEKLLLRAPFAGRVIGYDLVSLQDTYLKPGDEFCSIAGGGEHKELSLSISQSDAELYADRIDQTLEVRIWGQRGRLLAGRLTRLTPQASQKVPHEALSAAAGGPLIVQPAMGKKPSSDQASEESYELIQPRFAGIVQFDATPGVALRAGQRATVRFHTHHETVGGHLYRMMHQWLRDKIEMADAAAG
jgi:putative peptide zinc metalloprotease protein